MSLIAFNLYIVACIAFHNAGGQELDNVIACGGFINLGNTVDSQLTYEELKIELQIDKHDIIKEVAEVLPNGAYSVPVYDAGQYRIRLYAPSGWIFHPSEGHVIDIRSFQSSCVENYDFRLIGFSVTGQVVTAGLETGPAGLFVTLINTEPPGLNIKTQTKSKGLFLLTPVPSGHYTILVGDSSEDIHKTTRAISEVEVSSTNFVLRDPIILHGHFLRGTVRERQGPELFADLRVILFAANKQTASSYFAHISKPCSSASNSSLGDIPHQYHVPEEILNSATAICETNTDSKGTFKFHGLPGGDYLVVPHPVWQNRLESLRLHFHPAFRALSMEHSDVWNLGEDIEGGDVDAPSFTVIGFSASAGQILWASGRPISGAKLKGDLVECAQSCFLNHSIPDNILRRIGDCTLPDISPLTNDAGVEPGHVPSQRSDVCKHHEYFGRGHINRYIPQGCRIG